MPQPGVRRCLVLVALLGPGGAAAGQTYLSGTDGPSTLPRGWREPGPSPNAVTVPRAGSQTRGSMGTDGQRLCGVLALSTHGSSAAAGGGARDGAREEAECVPKDTQCSARGAAGPALASLFPRAGVAPTLQRHSSGRPFCLGKSPVSALEMASAPSPLAAHLSWERGHGHRSAGHPGAGHGGGLGAGEGHGQWHRDGVQMGPQGWWGPHEQGGMGGSLWCCSCWHAPLQTTTAGFTVPLASPVAMGSRLCGRTLA